jgi:ABC-type nickel/cobalt efflux system permease component RcnA
MMRGAMELFPAVTAIAQTIQLSLAPVFLLAGIGAVLNVLAGRLARVIDRARELERLHPTTSGHEHDRHVTELRLLDRRMGVINAALYLCVSSAIAVCSVVALLFVGELATLRIGTIVALIFIAAMALLVTGLVMFLVEVRMSLHATRIRADLLR